MLPTLKVTLLYLSWLFQGDFVGSVAAGAAGEFGKDRVLATSDAVGDSVATKLLDGSDNVIFLVSARGDIPVELVLSSTGLAFLPVLNKPYNQPGVFGACGVADMVYAKMRQYEKG